MIELQAIHPDAGGEVDEPLLDQDNSMKPFPTDPIEGTRSARSTRRPERPVGRDYQGRHWVYTQLSGQTRGLSVGVNLSPDGVCDYRCRYCRTAGQSDLGPIPVDGGELARELEETLESIRTGHAFNQPAYRRYPAEWRTLSQVMLSGEGEPTLCPNFVEVVEKLIHARARGRYPFFKLVLETNGSGLDRSEVREGLDLFTAQDEVWVKLDAGTEDRFRLVAGVDLPFQGVLARILSLARQRPVVIHSLFASVAGVPPCRSEISAYLRCLTELRDQGAMLQRVQIYSVTHYGTASDFSHLPLSSLSEIARQVRREVGVEAEVF
jgi:wyosine [tRNA(Phe)-imidazoG37] synthetase (radical SAM superfamily)